MSTGDPTPSLFEPTPAKPAGAPRPSPASTSADEARPAGQAPKPRASGKATGKATGKAASKTAGKAGGEAKVSPMMQQYYRAKKDAGDAVLMFRMGDFYELFHDDARTASRVLGITLTSRSKGENAIPMAGVPVKAYEGYLATLIRAGYRVAICDQVQDPKQAKGLVERRVTRIVTAGTVYEDDLLRPGTSNWLLAVWPSGDQVGLAWLDVSTGDFRVTVVGRSRLGDEVSRLDPAEILLPETLLEAGSESASESGPDGELVACLRRASHAPLRPAPQWTFQHRNALELLTEQFQTASLQGFGLEDDGLYVPAAGAALAYVADTLRSSATAITALKRHDPGASAGLDRATRGCLEILATQREGRREGSLLAVVDATATAMGARLLREWLVAPLTDPERIRRRQSAVAELVDRRHLADALSDTLTDLPDLERIATRLLAGRGSPRDLAALRVTLRAAPRLREALEQCDSAPLADAGRQIEPAPELLDLLERGLADPPGAVLADGGVIVDGFDQRLDELRGFKRDGTAAIARFQTAEAERTGVAGLKVAYNKVFGYFVEISHAQARGITLPPDYVRKQTLTNAERYITDELKTLETKILTADERSKALELELFTALRERAIEDAENLRNLARAVARVDVLRGFADIASERAWTRPEVDDSLVIEITDGRHPVLEMLRPAGELVPNDVLLDHDTARLVLITGPNMAGKSTYIRQVALLVLLAQVGAFVPAAAARIGVVDRIFTRIGSADDLSAGVSTFMVEMTETAAILHGATDRSLVILDEVGRGTSTWDGLSLAWAVSEYLYKAVGARTLFATHYHELVDLAEEFEAVRNVNVAVQEWGDQIVFLHKILPGATDRSYGLHVAGLAGVPGDVIERAQRILHDLEQRSPDLKPGPREAPAGAVEPEPLAPSLFPKPAASVLDEIGALDPDLVAPMEALRLLRRFHATLGGRVSADPSGLQASPRTSSSTTLR